MEMEGEDGKEVDDCLPKSILSRLTVYFLQVHPGLTFTTMIIFVFLNGKIIAARNL